MSKLDLRQRYKCPIPAATFIVFKKHQTRLSAKASISSSTPQPTKNPPQESKVPKVCPECRVQTVYEYLEALRQRDAESERAGCYGEVYDGHDEWDLVSVVAEEVYTQEWGHVVVVLYPRTLVVREVKQLKLLRIEENGWMREGVMGVRWMHLV